MSLSDPASRWTAAQAGLATFAYCTNYLIDLDHAVIVDVEPSTAVRQGELAACRTMVERTEERLGLHPERLTADTAYGSAEMLEGLVHDQGIASHIPVFDKSKREDGTFSREDFSYDAAGDLYRCPGGNELKRYRRAFSSPRTDPPADHTHRYRGREGRLRRLRAQEPVLPKARARKVTPSIHEAARDVAREIAKTDAYWTSMRQRKKVEMLFAHLKRILKLERLRLRGPCGARDEVLLAATAPAPGARWSGGIATRASFGTPASPARNRLLRHNQSGAELGARLGVGSPESRHRAGPVGSGPSRTGAIPSASWRIRQRAGACHGETSRSKGDVLGTLRVKPRPKPRPSRKFRTGLETATV